MKLSQLLLSQLLQTRPEFAAFGQLELAALEKALRVARYEPEHQFLGEGKRGGTMYLIVEGEVRVTRNRRKLVEWEKQVKATPEGEDPPERPELEPLSEDVNIIEHAGYPVARNLGPGDMFGVISLIDPGKCTATCTADTCVTVASLPRHAVMLLMQNHAPLATHFQQLVADQLARDFGCEKHEVQSLLVSGQYGAIRAVAEYSLAA